MARYFDAFRQGRFFRHPIHPFLVHLPMGLWVAALLLDLLSWSGLNAKVAGPLLVASYYCIEIGLLSAIVSIPFGMIDFSYTVPGSRARSSTIAHVAFIVPAIALEAVNFALRKNTEGNPQPPGPLGGILSVAAVCFLVVSGYLGGTLVFQHGAGRTPRNRALPPLRGGSESDLNRPQIGPDSGPESGKEAA